MVCLCVLFLALIGHFTMNIPEIIWVFTFFLSFSVNKCAENYLIVSWQDDSVGQATEIQGTYIRKKLAVLSSRLGSKTENVRGQVKDKKTVGR